MRNFLNRVLLCLAIFAVCLILTNERTYAEDTIRYKTSSEDQPGAWKYENGVWSWYRAGCETGSLLPPAGPYTNTLLLYKDNYYYLDAQGVMAIGWKFIDNNWYYFKPWGGMYQDAFVEYKGNKYYLDNQGIMATGWKLISDDWYYFKSWGGMYENSFVEYKTDIYYLKNDGKMAVGWMAHNGIWYYFNESGDMRHNSFVTYKGNEYYLHEDGKMAIGWTQIDSDWYYMYNWGGVYKSTFLDYKGNTYYLGQDGKMAIGWTEIEDSWYYFLPWGGAVKGEHLLPAYSDEDTNIRYVFDDFGKLIGNFSDYIENKTENEKSDINMQYSETIQQTTWEYIDAHASHMIYGEIVDVEVMNRDNFTYVAQTIEVESTLKGDPVTGQQIHVFYFPGNTNPGFINVPAEAMDKALEEKIELLMQYSASAEYMNKREFESSDPISFSERYKFLDENVKVNRLSSWDGNRIGDGILPEKGMKIITAISLLNEEQAKSRGLDAGDYIQLAANDGYWVEIDQEVFYCGLRADSTNAIVPDKFSELIMQFMDKDSVFTLFEGIGK